MNKTTTNPVPEKTIAVKIDVDTRQGMEHGVPKLLETLDTLGIKASFFLSFGPDRSGTAILNIIRQKGFLKKMLRTNAIKQYGWRTIFSGTLLPAKPIASDFPQLVERMDQAGHEVGVHAWDHRQWQDKLERLPAKKIREHLEKSGAAYRSILQRPTRSVAAPAWKVNRIALQMEDEMELLYASDTRGNFPFYPKVDGIQFATPQFPTTMPCIEELVTLGERRERLVERLCKALRPTELNVFPAHAEIEGTTYADLLQQFVQQAQSAGYQFVTLERLVTQTLANGALPVRHLIAVTLPGRAGLVAAPSA